QLRMQTPETNSDSSSTIMPPAHITLISDWKSMGFSQVGQYPKDCLRIRKRTGWQSTSRIILLPTGILKERSRKEIMGPVRSKLMIREPGSRSARIGTKNFLKENSSFASLGAGSPPLTSWSASEMDPNGFSNESRR